MSIHSFRSRGGSLRTLVQGVSLLALAAACSQDPAFVNKTKEAGMTPAIAGKRGGDADSKSGGIGSPETNAGEKGAQRGDGDPATGDVIAHAPGVIPGGSGYDGNESGAAGASGQSGDGAGGSSSGGSRGGSNETPNTGMDDPVRVPTANPTPVTGGNPTPAPTAAPTPGGAPHAGEQVVFDTMQKQGKVDILWVVDDSGSMDWAQDQLTSKFESFARKLTEARVDFRVAVTTTDVCDIDWSNGKPKTNAHCPELKNPGNGGQLISGGTMIDGAMVGPPQGRFLVDPTTKLSVLTNATPNFASTFARVAKAGTSGSSYEHGLTAAKMAVEKAIAGVNKNFLRSDAPLSVIVLSDEEDEGVQFWCEDAWGRTTLNASGQKDSTKCKTNGTSPFLDAFGMRPYGITVNPATNAPWTNYKFTADDFKTFLDRADVKGPGKARVSTITGIRGADGKIACDNPGMPNNADKSNAPMESGTNYIKAAGLTGGVVENICSSEWSQLLGNLGQNVGELANQIALPAGKIPFPGTLEVYVDGAKWDAAKYSYKADGNFVVFKVVPPSGAAIKVKYAQTVR